MACAPLIESETLTLTQYSEKEVTISQTSPYEYTVITNSLVRDMVSFSSTYNVRSSESLRGVALACNKI